MVPPGPGRKCPRRFARGKAIRVLLPSLERVVGTPTELSERAGDGRKWEQRGSDKGQRQRSLEAAGESDVRPGRD
ncbi:hypothetical protein Dda_9170 [Drechslerella dactyloides]|uniref:Uncharacterized protein n=1 Tax=Drechslerella dactyloides TaxID=74499 RepID=A0AAD6IPU1_DREDA|nr:hypothetical protein Dda_9170 [Drechslerella dactyloides]